MQVDLAGQVALVRGSDGIWGQAIARRLMASGARVVRTGSAAEARRDAGRLDILVNADPLLIEAEGDGAAQAAASQAATAQCQQAVAAMDAGGIVNVGSIYGLVPGRGRAGLAGACAALFGQTRAMALEMAAKGIRVNGVALMPEDRSHTPLGRAAQPADVATTVLFLLAAASSYVVGEIIRVDGGWSAGFAREF